MPFCGFCGLWRWCRGSGDMVAATEEAVPDTAGVAPDAECSAALR